MVILRRDTRDTIHTKRKINSALLFEQLLEDRYNSLLKLEFPKKVFVLIYFPLKNIFWKF